MFPKLSVFTEQRRRKSQPTTPERQPFSDKFYNLYNSVSYDENDRNLLEYDIDMLIGSQCGNMLENVAIPQAAALCRDKKCRPTVHFREYTN